MKQHNTYLDFCQPLADIRANGKPQPWKEQKEQTALLAYAYGEILNDAKASRVLTCAPRLSFSQKPDGRLKLENAVFCRVRLCPVCQWRRSLKLFGQTKQVIDEINKRQKSAFIMLTLTVRNVDSLDLGNEISIIHAAWQRLMQRKEVKRAVIGWQRCLEVTHNVSLNSGSYNTYHPHIHALLCVRPSYFNSRDYISHEQWKRLWKEAARLDYEPQVWIKRVKDDHEGAVAEVTKYASKPGDYLTAWDLDLMTESVELLDAALHRRRLVAYGGLMKTIHKELGLDDVENGDLVHTDNEEEKAEAAAALIHFEWVPGYRQYFKTRE